MNARPSVREAKQVAAMLRRCGYPEAQAATEYCIDGHIGPDGFYTYTVAVYAGKKQPTTIPRGVANAMGLK